MILDGLPGVVVPEDLRRGRLGRRFGDSLVVMAVSESVSELGVVTPLSEENSSLSSDACLIYYQHQSNGIEYLEEDFVFEIFWARKF